MSTTLRVAGQFIEATIGAAGELEWSHRWPGGSWDASWTMDLPANYPHTVLVVDALVEIMRGPVVVWSGVLDQPVYDFSARRWTITAEGKCRLAERFLCLNSSSASTTIPHTAVDRAIIRGLTWTSTLAGTTEVVVGDTTNSLNWLNVLLDAYATEDSKRWGVTPSGALFFQADPTTPTLQLVPGSGTLSIADEQVASRLFGRYKPTSTTFATVNVTDAAAQVTRGYREGPEDLTQRGVMTSGRATAYLTARMALGASQPAWANGLRVGSLQLRGPGGGPVDLESVGVTPEVVRINGVTNPVNKLLGYLDFVVGEVRIRRGADDIELLPLGVVKNTLRSAVTPARPGLTP